MRNYTTAELQRVISYGTCPDCGEALDVRTVTQPGGRSRTERYCPDCPPAR